MTPNYTLQRTGEHHRRTVSACMYARAGAESAPCLTAELGRQSAHERRHRADEHHL